jgi:hypothetical protein
VKELEDYTWFPQLLRRFQTDYIGFFVMKFRFYDPFVSHLKQLNWNGKQFDLCSGSGQPALSIFQSSKGFDSLILSDKFPDFKHIDVVNVQVLDSSVDVLEMEFEANVTYTMFNALHHFSDAQKKDIVSKIIHVNGKAVFVEILNPSLLQCVKVVLAGTIGALLMMPFVRPFSAKRLFFTYLLPINLFTITYDGLVSVFKSRSVKKYRELFHSKQVEVFELKSKLQSLTVIQINSQ